jgi:hypothetical protein
VSGATAKLMLVVMVHGAALGLLLGYLLGRYDLTP